MTNHPFAALATVITADWRMDALCPQVSIEEFHAGHGRGSVEQINFAKKVCGLCPVKAECLEFALTNDEREGIWGGLSPRVRDQLRAQRGIKSKPAVEHWHGTEAGARRHNRNGTPPCTLCADAAHRARQDRDRRRAS
jgi:hypothetical protein